MMKTAGKFAMILLLAALMLIPFQSAQAKGLLDVGPIFGGNFTLKSGETLEQDLLVFGGSVAVEKNARLNGSIVVMGGSVIIDGEVSEDIVFMGGSITVNGEVFKNVVVLGGTVKLGENSRIHSNLVTAGALVDRAEGARVDGDVVNNTTQPSNPARDLGFKDFFTPNTSLSLFDPVWETLQLFGWSLLLGLLAALIVLFLPDHVDRVGKSAIAQPIPAGGWGLLTVILAPVILVILSITLILIPVAALAGIILGAAFVFGWVGIGMEIGSRAMKMFNIDWPLPLAAGLGTFLLTLVADGIKLFPCVGWLVPSIIAMIGLGAVFMTRFGSRPLYIPPAPVPVQPVPPVENPS